MTLDGLHIAAYIGAAATVLSIAIAAIKFNVRMGEFVNVLKKVPAEITAVRGELRTEMSGIRDELRTSNENTLRVFEQHAERFGNHSERLAVVEAMLSLDDAAQAKEGPRIRRRGRGGREL